MGSTRCASAAQPARAFAPAGSLRPSTRRPPAAARPSCRVAAVPTDRAPARGEAGGGGCGRRGGWKREGGTDEVAEGGEGGGCNSPSKAAPCATPCAVPHTVAGTCLLQHTSTFVHKVPVRRARLRVLLVPRHRPLSGGCGRGRRAAACRTRAGPPCLGRGQLCGALWIGCRIVDLLILRRQCPLPGRNGAHLGRNK